MRTQWLWGALALAAAACTETNDPPPEPVIPPDPAAVEAACESIGEARAARAAACTRGDAAFIRAAWFRPARCFVARHEVASGNATFRPAAVQACLDAVATLDCGSAVYSEVPACDAVILGNVADGGACVDDVDCAHGSCEIGSACPGTCAAPLAAGSGCSVGGPRCAPGTTCRDDGGARRCLAPVGAGGLCSWGGCADGLSCDRASGTCVPRKTSGTCAGDEDCAPGFACDWGDAGADRLTCLVVAGRGEPCGAGAPCGRGWTCTRGVCGPPPAVGSACASSGSFWDAGASCDAGAYCDLRYRFDASDPGTCMALTRDGGRCEHSGRCRSGVCHDGRCAASPCVPFPVPLDDPPALSLERIGPASPHQLPLP